MSLLAAGTWLLVWPCFWSIALAAPPGSLPDPYNVALFGIGALLLRGAGCTVNDLWDRDLDAAVERTRGRPLASGALTVRQGLGGWPGLLLGSACMLAVQAQAGNWPGLYVVCQCPLAARQWLIMQHAGPEASHQSRRRVSTCRPQRCQLQLCAGLRMCWQCHLNAMATQSWSASSPDIKLANEDLTYCTTSRSMQPASSMHAHAARQGSACAAICCCISCSQRPPWSSPASTSRTWGKHSLAACRAGCLAVQLILGLGVLLQLNDYSRLLGASSLLLVFTYPLFKRFTFWVGRAHTCAARWLQIDTQQAPVASDAT